MTPSRPQPQHATVAHALIFEIFFIFSQRIIEIHMLLVLRLWVLLESAFELYKFTR